MKGGVFGKPVGHALITGLLAAVLRAPEVFAQIPAAPGDEGVAPPDEEPDRTSAPAFPPAAIPTQRGSNPKEIVDMMHRALKTPTVAPHETSKARRSHRPRPRPTVTPTQP